jgi:hypothetical protein
VRKLGTVGVVCAVATAIALMLAPAADGAFGVSRWEAGTCKSDAPHCTYGSPSSQFFTQAAGHPNVGLTDFEFNKEGTLPSGNVKDVRVDLPEGLNVDPQAVPQCPKATFEANPANCAASQVGVSEVSAVKLELKQIPILGGILEELVPNPTKLEPPVYNLVPEQGEPALFGFHVEVPAVLSENVYLKADIDWAGDYHEGFTINNIPNSVPLTENRLVFNGQAGGTFLTMGSQCNGPSTTGLKVDSYQNPGTFLPYATTPPANITGCTSVPFNPTVAASVNGAATDSSANTTVTLNIPQKTQPLNNSTVKAARVTLPQGVSLNPATAPGLEFCPNSSFPIHSRAPVKCPAKSQVGTVSIQTPVLPANSLTGPVYLAPQESREPLSGKTYRIFFDAVSSRYGIDVRLEGKVAANPQTGQLTATFEGAPQVSFSSVTLNFGGTPGHAIPALSSPPICTTTSTSQITPWSTGNAVTTPATNLTLTQAPGGKPCAKNLGERPFTPGFSAKPVSTKAAAYTPYQLRIGRTDGQQEIKGMELTLPPGATAKLAGVAYCPPQALAKAAGNSGTAEKKNPSCPSSSKIGIAKIEAGTGGSPLAIEGIAYLAGPYEGAPLSLAVVTPALAGPFDLGVVAIRAPLFVDPETAQIHTVTKAIPDVFGGAKLDIKSVFVNLNRKEFTLNGTNCAPMATAGSIFGGGSDPSNPAAFSAAPVSSNVQGTGCGELGFKPTMKLRLFGAHKRNKNPKLRATLTARAGDANIARASVALPHALFLDQSSLNQVCTRVQFAASQCPQKSVYGFARAWSPLLDQPLEGPVYLRSSNNELPDMVAALQGQIDIVLDGRIDSFKGGIRTTFDRVPDVPISKFVLTLPGGKHGLLVASRNLCRKAVKGIIQLKGQNGATANRRVKLQTPCSKSARKNAKGKKHKGKKGSKHHSKKHKSHSKKKQGKHKKGDKQKSKSAAN